MTTPQPSAAAPAPTTGVAGDAMDVLIGQRVFGHEVFRCIEVHYAGVTCGKIHYRSESGWPAPALPRYSRDMAAAWTVVEHLRERGYWFELRDHEERTHRDVWEAEFRGTHTLTDGWATADTAQLAICRAALRAIEDRAEAGGTEAG